MPDCNPAQRRPGRSPRRHVEYTIDWAIYDGAQRRPGRSPRRHLRRPPRGERGGGAQRRPGRSPRRHLTYDESFAAYENAQRRPGRSPRRHPAGWEVGQPRDLRSTKAGAFTPATRSTARYRYGPVPPLNEGRGVHPGDTGSRRQRRPLRGRDAQRRPGRSPRRHAAHPLETTDKWAAQRRPGRSPRRHVRLPVGGSGDDARSTKAGAFTPATRPVRWSASARGPRAQRRPGRSPRRHPSRVWSPHRSCPRSTKAGVLASSRK